jgi:ABC-type branched-subunit amino acid transport system substrate-binding protein
MRTARTAVVGLAVFAALAIGAGGAGAQSSGSAPGVTASTIKLAYPNIDWAKLKSSGINVAVDHGDDDKILKALVDDINAKGGVAGRKLDVEVVKYDTLNPATGESACVKMTEDDKVFAVIHPFQGPLMSVNTCITDHKTVLVGGDPDPTVAAKKSWISPDASQRRAASLLVSLLDKKGALKGKTIGVATDPGQEQVTKQVLVPALKKAGHPAKVVVVDDAPAGDVTATDANWQVFVQKFKSAGVNHIILMGNEAGTGPPRILGGGLKVAMSSPNSNVTGSLGRSQTQRPPADYDGIYTLTAASLSEAFESPATQACVKVFEKANPGIKVKNPDGVAKGDPDWGTGIADACNQLSLFKLVADKAGKNLTNASFRKAAQSMTTNFASGYHPYNTFGPTKFDANNGFHLAVFDHTIGDVGALRPVGNVVNLG